MIYTPKHNPQGIVIDGISYVPESDYHSLEEELRSVSEKYRIQCEQLADERIMLNADLHQAQLDRLELKKIYRQLFNEKIQRALNELPLEKKQQLRDCYMELHANNPNAKKRFDNAIAEPRGSRHKSGPL
jgi:hypothetical protein